MLSYIELPQLEAGNDYELQIAVDKQLFMQAQEEGSLPTCLQFDLNIEHIPIQITANSDASSQVYNVIGILPSEIEKLTNESQFKIEVKFDKDLEI